MYKEEIFKGVNKELPKNKLSERTIKKGGSRASLKQEEFANRLIERGESALHKRRRLLLEREIVLDAEYEKQCTFNPVINPKTARSKYSETCQNKGPSLENEDLTFKPAINTRTTSLLKKNSSYSSGMSPFERLYSRKDSKKALEGINVSTVPRATIDLKQFIYRQEIREKIKKEKLELMAKTTVLTTTSLINEKSKKIAAKLGDFDTRMRSQKFKLESNESIGKDWFHPKINTKVSCNLLTAVPSTERNKKSTDTLVEKAPKLTKAKQYNNVESKLKLNTDINTLVTRIKTDKESKEKSKNHERQVKNIEEELRCTYKPKINGLPSYITTSIAQPKEHSKKV